MNVKSCLHLLLWLGLMLQTASVFALNVTANVDRTKVKLGDTFTYTISIESDTQRQYNQPNLDALQRDFIKHHIMSSQKHSIINGDVSIIKEWHIVLSARQKGNWTIPSIEIEGQRTPEIKVTILEPSASIANEDDERIIFLQAKVNKSEVYAGEQIILTLNIYYAVNITKTQIHMPRLEGAQVEVLGNDRYYHTNINGKQYRAIERKFILFPKNTGAVEIAPITMNAVYSKPLHNRDRFDLFMSLDRGVQASASTKPIKLNVLDKLEATAWLPASKVRMTSQWNGDSSKIKVGQPITREITIEADGVLANLIPELSLETIDGIQFYHDKPELTNQYTEDGVTGKRVEKIAYLPNKDGALEIPKLTIRWFNVKTKSFEFAKVGAQTIMVAAVEPATIADVPITDSTAQNQESSNMTLPSWLIWVLILGALLIIVLITLLGYLVYQMKHAKNVPHKGKNASDLIKQLELACRDNDVAKVIDALLAWAKQIWPDKALVSLAAIADHIGDDALRNAFVEIDKAQYAKSTDHAWQGDVFWQMMQPHLKMTVTLHAKQKSLNDLPPLYPSDSSR